VGERKWEGEVIQSTMTCLPTGKWGVHWGKGINPHGKNTPEGKIDKINAKTRGDWVETG